MWEMSKYSSSSIGGGGGGGGGFHGGEKMVQACGGGDHFGNRHSISFKSGGDSNSSSSGKFALGGMLGVGSSSSKAPAAPGGLPLNSVPGLNPDVELAVEWSPEEQLILEDGLSKYADEPNILKYIKISAALPEKTVRDVALRCRWMTKKENGKRRKPEENYTGKKMKDRKEKTESSCKPSTPPAPPLNMGAYSLMMHHTDQNDRISSEVTGIGGTTRHLLDENTQLFSHITANLASFKIQENIDLFCRSRNNILSIINDMRAMPGIMSQMPPLPVSINDELANVILPNTAQTMIYCSPTTIYGKPPERRC